MTGSLAMIQRSAQLLANAKTLDDLNKVRVVGEAAIRLAKNHRDVGQNAIIDAQVIVRTAERRIGKELAGMEGKGRHGGDRKSSGQRDHLIDKDDSTAAKIAREHGVGERTVRRAGEFAEAVEKAKETDPDIEQKVLEGQVRRREVVQRAKQRLSAADYAPRDADGRTIPRHLRGVFAQTEEFKRFASAISVLKGQVTQAVGEDPVAWSQFNDNGFRAALTKAHDYIALSAPHIVCAYCGGEQSENCTGCKGTGFLTKAQARCVPKKMRGGQS